MLGRESNRRAQSIGGKILLPRFVSRLYMAKNRLEYLTRKDRARLLDRRKPVAVEKGEEVFVFARFLAGPAGQDGFSFRLTEMPGSKDPSRCRWHTSAPVRFRARWLSSKTVRERHHRG